MNAVPEGGVGSPGARVTDGSSLYMGAETQAQVLSQIPNWSHRKGVLTLYMVILHS